MCVPLRSVERNHSRHPMSSHFKNAQEVKAETRWSKFVRIVLWKPSSVDEKAVARHCYFRVTVFCCVGAYYAYWHPEYSVISAWWHGTNEPIVHRAVPFNPGEFTHGRGNERVKRWLDGFSSDRSGVT